MKSNLLKCILCILLAMPETSRAQIAASIYNINRNDAGGYDFDEQQRHNRPGRILFATGLLVGGLAIGAIASQQDYFIGNTTIYGTGGIMTIVATGLVLGGANCLNREIKFAYTGNGIGMSICLDPPVSQKRKL